MSETLEVNKKSEAQVNEQITRIATKLAERAKKLPQDAKNENDPLAEFSTYDTDDDKALYHISTDKNGRHASVANDFIAPGEYYTTIDSGDEDNDIKVVADEGKVFAHKDTYTDTETDDPVSHELTQHEAVHEAAKALNDIRGAVAEQEIKASKR